MPLSLRSKWVQTNGPYGGSVPSLVVINAAAGGNKIFAGTRNSIFLSTDGGMHWSPTGFDVSGNVWGQVLAAETSGMGSTRIFAGTFSAGIFVSTNDGNTWTAMNNGLSNTNVQSICIAGGRIFAGTGGGVFVSTNGGALWSSANVGLSNTDVYAV